MPEWTLRYADARGELHQQVAEGTSERELRDRLTNQGFLVYSIKPRNDAGGFSASIGGPRGKKINLEKFLIFNQQFVTLIRAGLPILKSLDLLAERLTDAKLSRYIKSVREEVRNGAMLSDAFAKQGVFPPIYVTTVLAGERSGSLPEVLERFITYQRLALSVRKKLLVSLMYPSEIQAGFDQLQYELDEQIQSRMAQTRQLLLENFDEEVHERLKMRKQEAAQALDQRTEWLLSLARQELADFAQWNSPHRFIVGQAFQPAAGFPPGVLGFGTDFEATYK